MTTSKCQHGKNYNECHFSEGGHIFAGGCDVMHKKAATQVDQQRGETCPATYAERRTSEQEGGSRTKFQRVTLLTLAESEQVDWMVPLPAA
jgi:hypothetical protein